MKRQTIQSVLITAGLTLSLAVSATTNLHVVPLSLKNGITGAQACQQYWPGYATCIPTENTDQSQNINLSTPYGNGQISPGNAAAIVGDSHLKSASVMITNQGGKTLFQGSEDNNQGETCDSQSCHVWK